VILTTAVLAGIIAGILIVFTLFRTGMLAERSGSAVLLASVAVFYPVFAVIDGHLISAAVHFVIFLAFCWLATMGFRKGMHLIAGGLLAHGLFDIGLMAMASPGPDWWPAFCASLDIVAAAALVRLIQTRQVPQ